MALRPTHETAQTTLSPSRFRPRRGGLLLTSWCGAGRRLFFGKTGRPPGLSHVSQQAGSGCVPELTGRGTAGPTGQHRRHASEALRCASRQASPGRHVLATARRMKRSSPTRGHGQ